MTKNKYYVRYIYKKMRNKKVRERERSKIKRLLKRVERESERREWERDRLKGKEEIERKRDRDVVIINQDSLCCILSIRLGTHAHARRRLDLNDSSENFPLPKKSFI